MSIKFTSKGLADGTDSTKELEFNVAGVTTGTTRTITVPDRNLTIGNAGDLTGTLPAIDGSNLTNLPIPSVSYRYWKYHVVASLAYHHPRCSRLVMGDEGGTITTIHTYLADNCSDLGTMPSNSATFTYDFGSPTAIKRVGCYSTYGGGARASWIKVSGSTNNSTWVDMGTTAVYSIGCGITMGDI